MNYLITGGTGCIGQALIKQLHTHNVNITVLSRNIEKAQMQLNSKVIIVGKLTLDNIENADIVINLAGEPIADKRWSQSQKDLICNSRWSITQNIVNLIKQATKKPKLFISGSAIGIYGRQGVAQINENFTDYNKEFTNTVCENWELIAEKANSPFTRVALLRTGIVLSKNHGALAKMLPPFKLGLGGKIGSGSQVMSWIHVEDMVNAILYIIENEQLSGPINMTAQNPVSNTEFTSHLSKTLNRPCIFTTPTLLLKLIFGEMSELLTYGQNVYPEKLLASGFNFKYTNVDSALNALIKAPS